MRPLPGTELDIGVLTVPIVDNNSDLPYFDVKVNDSKQKQMNGENKKKEAWE